MAVIQSGAGASLWTIDPTSLAGRVTEYDSAGAELFPALPGFTASVRIRETGATAADAALFAMHVPATSTKTVFIKKIWGITSFDGTAGGAVEMGHYFCRGACAGNDASTGTNVVPFKKSTAGATSVMSGANMMFKATALTTTGIALATTMPLAMQGVPSSVSSMVVPWLHDFSQGGRARGLRIVADEGLFMCVGPTSVIGLTTWLNLEWDEITGG